MKTWLDELSEDELHAMETTIRAALTKDKLHGNTRLNAQMILQQVEDYLWSSVCRGSPAYLDQHQTAPQ